MATITLGKELLVFSTQLGLDDCLECMVTRDVYKAYLGCEVIL